MNSILTSIKKLLGIDPTYNVFDTDIIMHINTVFSILKQLGVGPSAGFRINDDSDTWDSYLGDTVVLESVKDYVYLRVKSMFDPPQSSSAMEANNQMIKELEWRIVLEVESQTDDS